MFPLFCWYVFYYRGNGTILPFLKLLCICGNVSNRTMIHCLRIMAEFVVHFQSLQMVHKLFQAHFSHSIIRLIFNLIQKVYIEIH